MAFVGEYDVDIEYPCYNDEYSKGFTKLMYLIITEKNNPNGHKNIVSYLSDKKNVKSINQKNKKGYTALNIAVRNCGIWCSYKTVRFLLEKGAKTNIKNNEGITPLIFASFNARFCEGFNVINLLLKYGADINARDNNGYTALMNASLNSNSSSTYSTVKLLLDNDANIDDKDRNGLTSLMHACNNVASKSSIGTVELLLYYGANINAADDNGQTALMHACYNSNNIELIELLLNSGADIEAVDNKGFTCLMIACKYSGSINSVEPIEILLDRGANIEAKNEKSRTPLMYTCKYSHNNIDVIKLLLDKGANIETTDVLNNTALIFASTYSSSVESVKILLDKGANINHTNDEGCNALNLACINSSYNNNSEIVKLLIDKGCNINNMDSGKTILTSTCEFIGKGSNIDTIKILLDNNADPNIPNTNGNTPLLYMCKKYIKDGLKKRDFSFNVIKLLLDYKADPNFINKKNENSLTRLSKYSNKVDIEIVKLLLDYDVDINSTNNYCNSALLLFCMELKHTNTKILDDCKNIIKLLLEKGANVNITNSNADTVLSIICESDDNNLSDIIELLLIHNVNPNTFDKNEYTPLMHLIESFDSYLYNFKSIPLDVESISFCSDSDLDNDLPPLEYPLIDKLDEIEEDKNEPEINYRQKNLEMLLKHKTTKINFQNNCGTTVLLHACQVLNTIEPIRLLLDNGADPNIQDEKGETALHKAVRNSSNKIEIVKLLLDYHANPCVLRNKGQDLLSYAFKKSSRNNFLNITKMLINNPYHVLSDENLIQIFGLRDRENTISIIKMLEHNAKIKARFDVTIDLIPQIVTPIIYNHKSLRARLVKLNWLYMCGDINQIITLDNFELFDYLCVENMDQLHDKIIGISDHI